MLLLRTAVNPRAECVVQVSLVQELLSLVLRSAMRLPVLHPWSALAITPTLRLELEFEFGKVISRVMMAFKSCVEV